MPERVQLKRTKGWRMPPNTVKVTRPLRWGNSWKVGSNMATDDGWKVCETAADCVEAYRRSVDWDPDAQIYLPTEDGYLIISGGYGPMHRNRRTIKAELRGKNLACWCPLDQPCHADVLLEIANS